MQELLLHPLTVFFLAHILLLYCMLFLFMFLEGEIALIIAGIGVHLGLLASPVVAILAVVAVILKMTVGYSFGAWLGRKYPESRFLRYIESRILSFLPQFRKKPFWSIVFSKCIYGLNNAALIFAGYTQANYRTYVRAEILSSIVWLGGMFGLGLFFSSAAMAISHSVHNFALLIGLFVLGFIILHKIVNLIVEIIEELYAKKHAVIKT